MTEKEIVHTLKEFVVNTNFKGGFEEGFLDSCDACELTEYFPNTRNNKMALVQNYIIWYYGGSVLQKGREL